MKRRGEKFEFLSLDWITNYQSRTMTVDDINSIDGCRKEKKTLH